jgi:predicted RNA-binding protein with PUA domain
MEEQIDDGSNIYPNFFVYLCKNCGCKLLNNEEECPYCGGNNPKYGIFDLPPEDATEREICVNREDLEEE